MLAFDVVSGASPTLPGRHADLARVLDALSESLTPAPEWRQHLDELITLEARVPDATTGTSLLHFGARADYLVVDGARVCFVDWPWAAKGARWVDLVAFLPSVVMQGGPDPEPVWRAHPWSHGVDDDAVDVFLAGLAGPFTRDSLLRAPPGLPTLRAFQSGQARIARAWLARRRGWSAAADL
jgi:hypothetical protein